MPSCIPRRTNGSSSSLEAGGRAVASFCRQAAKQVDNSCDHLSGCCNVAGGLEVIKNNARIVGLTSEYGGRLSAISIIVIPNDHMSVGVPYEPDSMSSGDIHKGVPMTVERFV